ncbi:NAD(P)/FAD-dependent oxidoreductase [Sphingomonas sp. Leaf38]|uniref:NAD(P)/FAD-dependent oxidoreductase n=1 Tax=Sphingomonas sp. Leaf38 TaxID=1736217 RepID=UPI0006F52B9B|nr:FAD-dependent oxidoreductase [Sphingomonas sp. Leaf38]KQN29680.1 deoxyribodipyrimidine photolyase [Sphingomonas sp. Leaf38]
MKVAIVGAGIAGLSCALRLQDAGHRVTLFDKGRGAGGRMSTRRIETLAGIAAFDHGAQYLTARDPGFAAAIGAWEAAGVVAPWPAAGDDAWVGTPGMSMIVKHLADRTDVRWQHQVTALRHDSAGWHIAPFATEPFDTVVLAVPAEQAAPLLADHDPVLANAARGCHASPCWTAMFAFAAPLAIADDIVKHAGIIGWAARNSAKPARQGPEAWVVQATPDWSTTHLEDPVDSVVNHLLAALAEQCPGPMPTPIVRAGHRWRYARAVATDLGCLWNADLGIGAAGDWLLAPRIESAWLSGRSLADHMLAD